MGNNEIGYQRIYTSKRASVDLGNCHLPLSTN